LLLRAILNRATFVSKVIGQQSFLAAIIALIAAGGQSL
jgi:hypothetical protein